ncbi:MAG: PD-(D/E)XK nuclease family protein, partial [Oscillospiraceae bacterium]|jgi:ATP-dependent helicase/nuclease subunit B|nr:PD-(D/E)XK nuclease family protein [Oscillospiraceae bacterium]
VASKPLARFIRAAADAEEYGFRQEDVLELLGTGLTRVPDARSGELENYIRLWKPDRRQWSDPQPWTLPPRGYGGAADDADARALRVVNAARVLLAAPFLRLRGASTALGWAKKFSEFLQSCRVPRALKRRAEALGRMGRRKLADESAQLWDIAVNALEQCAAVLGDRPMTRAQFAELYLLCVGAYSVGAIPAGLDRVSVGTAGRLRRLEVRAVLMLGCRAELMPRFAAPESLLAPEELSAIEGAGAEIPPKDEERYARARFDLYMAAALPSRFLCVTACPEANGKFLPAELFENICAVARIVPVQHSRAKRPPAAMDWLRAPLGEDAVEGLYGRDVYLSASRLESLMGCRQAFFLRYGLRAAPRRTESWTPLERGSFIHWVLEQTGRRFLGREISEIPESEIRAAAENAAMDYIETSLRGFKGQRKRFERSFAALTAAALEAADNVFAELKVSDFRPVAYELAFGGGGDMPAVQVGRTGRFSVRAGGKTDRVDVWQDPEGKRYIRAVDYKTGAAELDYTGLLYGFDIQLPLYLSALTDAWGDIPAGFLYVPAGSAPARSDRRLSEEDAAEQRDASRRRKGLVLDDGRVLRAMERSDDCRFIPVRYKKDGTPDARSGVISESQMRALSGHVRKTLEKAAEELTGGNVDASPAGGESRCERCDYRECCYFDSKRDVLRELTKADKKAFLAAIGGDDGGE